MVAIPINILLIFSLCEKEKRCEIEKNDTDITMSLAYSLNLRRSTVLGDLNSGIHKLQLNLSARQNVSTDPLSFFLKLLLSSIAVLALSVNLFQITMPFLCIMNALTIAFRHSSLTHTGKVVQLLKLE